MIGALITRSLGFAAMYLITRGLGIGEAPVPPTVTLRIFGPAPSGPGRHFGPAPSGTPRVFETPADTGGTGRIFKS